MKERVKVEYRNIGSYVRSVQEDRVVCGKGLKSRTGRSDRMWERVKVAYRKIGSYVGKD